jgi:hypothetical protein
VLRRLINDLQTQRVQCGVDLALDILGDAHVMTFLCAG